MGLANIINSLSTNTLPPYTIIEYQDLDGVPGGADSTSLIEIELPALYTTEPSYRETPRTLLTGKSYAIKLVGFSISCLSTSYNVRILNRNDITKINTLYEVYKTSSAINLHTNIPFYETIIRNRDIILDNKLYLYISNSALIDTGIITIELSYVSLQDREF